MQARLCLAALTRPNNALSAEADAGAAVPGPLTHLLTPQAEGCGQPALAAAHHNDIVHVLAAGGAGPAASTQQ
jgi:hypothetical protein